MPIVGDHPESGLRFVLERPAAGPPWEYRGHAFTPDSEHTLEVRVEENGDVAVKTGGSAPEDLAEKTRLLFRALYKQAKNDGDRGPARKVVRWRGEK